MSVQGEFRRLAARCIEFLEASDARAAESWAASLHSARAIARDDLNEAASRVLELTKGPPSVDEIDFATVVERDEFRERSDHLVAIACAILGRPVDELESP